MALDLSSPARTVRQSSTPFVVLAGSLTLLCVIGLIMVASASGVESAQLYGSSWAILQKQVAGMLGGAVLAYWFSRLSIKRIRLISWPLMAISLMLLVYTLKAGVEVGGQRNWIRVINGWQFQPSELAKLALVLFCAHMIANAITHVHQQWKTITSISLASGVFVGLVLLERDLGTPIILAGISVSILYASGLGAKWIAGIIGAGMAAVRPVRRG